MVAVYRCRYIFYCLYREKGYCKQAKSFNPDTRFYCPYLEKRDVA